MCCIAPVIAVHVFPGSKVTVGESEGAKWPYGGTVGAIEAYGGMHETRPFDGACVDRDLKLVTAPAYMYDGEPHEIHASIGGMVSSALALIE